MPGPGMFFAMFEVHSPLLSLITDPTNKAIGANNRSSTPVPAPFLRLRPLNPLPSYLPQPLPHNTNPQEPTNNHQLLRSPIWHRFVGGIHKRYRWARNGKTQEEILEESSGTNEKSASEEGRQLLLKHFRDEIRTQWRDIGLGGKGAGGDKRLR